MVSGSAFMALSLSSRQLKEYNDLEIVLKNSLNEVEKREKQLALGETQVRVNWRSRPSLDTCV